MNFKTQLCTTIGILGSFLSDVFGGWSSDLQTLVIFIAADFITGLILAVYGKSTKSESGALNSKASFRGLCKKGVIFLFVLISHRLDLMLDVNYIRTATIIGFIVNELISIVENAGLMGIKMPVINKAIDLLRDKGDENEIFK
jgi:toxin secretion/phage lysis holin